jgi:cell division protein ZipA
MSAVQWALLIFGVVAVVVVYFYSRRERARTTARLEPTVPAPAAPAAPTALDRQMDIFSTTGQFDEFGVGKPRRAGSPKGEAESAAAASAPAEAPPQPEKIVSLLIAEREGTHILGEQLHEALRAQGLEYGARQIYHRLADGKPVFSVASLLKPGYLDPAQAQGFTTPGLAVFMILPGPVPALTAFQDMLHTAQSLASALNAELYDSKRQLMTTTTMRAMQTDVENWAHLHLR